MGNGYFPDNRSDTPPAKSSCNKKPSSKNPLNFGLQETVTPVGLEWPKHGSGFYHQTIPAIFRPGSQGRRVRRLKRGKTLKFTFAIRKEPIPCP